jgi:hypothetical protein
MLAVKVLIEGEDYLTLHCGSFFAKSPFLPITNHQTMNLQGMPNKGRPESPFADPLPTKTSFTTLSSPSTVSPTPSASCDPKDDLEIMLLHEDFATLLSAAADLKEIREHIALHREKDEEQLQRKKHGGSSISTTTGGDQSADENGDEASEEASSSTSHAGGVVVVPVFQQIAKSAEHNNQILTALDRMQKALVVSAGHHGGNAAAVAAAAHAAGGGAPPHHNAKKIPSGRYPVIDSVLEDAIAKLQHEYECCEAWIQKQFPTTQAGGIAFKKRDRTTLAVKYPKAQTDILMEWMIENREDPFPTEDDLCMLAERTGLTTSQVVNWTTNVRKRNRKAVLDNKKKPHHFIDFLFLVQERENKKEESRRMYAWQHRKSPEQQQQHQHHPSPQQPHQPSPQQQQQQRQYQSPASLPTLEQQGGAAASWPPPRSSPLSHHHNSSPSVVFHNGHHMQSTTAPSPPSPHQQIQVHQQQPRYQPNHHLDRSISLQHRRSAGQLFHPLDRSMSGHRNSSSRSYAFGGTPPDLAVPDGCISKRIFDEVEDLSASAKQYDDLMGTVKIEDWSPVVEGGDVGGDTAAAATDDYHHGHVQRQQYSYHQPHHGHHHVKPQQQLQQQQQQPHHHHHSHSHQYHVPQQVQVQQQPRNQQHIMANASMDSDGDDEERHRVSSLDFEIEHNGKDIDDLVTKNITTHDDML